MVQAPDDVPAPATVDVPAGQFVQAVAEPPDHVPAGQLVQRPPDTEYVPAGHASQVEVVPRPGRADFPAGHLVHGKVPVE